MHVAIVLILVALGSVAFHIWSPFWWTEIASNWGYVDATIVLTFWITGLVFVAVLLFTAYYLLVSRYPRLAPKEDRPTPFLYLAVPALLLLFIGLCLP